MIVNADARRLPLRTGLAQTCVTSPPYWGLRDYGLGGRGIGLEASVAAYVSALVVAFREVRRVLRPDGTLWLNLGDCYTNDGGMGSQGKNGQRADRRHTQKNLGVKIVEGIKRKNLLGIPWRMAFALQEDGWNLRAEIMWAKPNPMPESVTDRPTRAHETVFLLSPSLRYYYDADAICEPHVSGDHPRHGTDGYLYQAPGQRAHAGISASRRPQFPDGWASGPGPHDAMGHSRRARAKTAADPHAGGRRQAPEPGEPAAFHPLGRNKRDVWTIPTEPFPDAHFATMPRGLVEPCILAGSRPGDLVIDPFGGSGTVAQVAVGLGRRAAICDLSADYCAGVARRRLARVQRGLPLARASA